MYPVLPFDLKLLRCMPENKLLNKYILKRVARDYLERREQFCTKCYDSDEEEEEYIFQANPFLGDERYSYFHKFSGNNDVLRLHSLISHNVKPIIIYTIFYLNNLDANYCAHLCYRSDIISCLYLKAIFDRADNILSRSEIFQLICIGISLLGLATRMLRNYHHCSMKYKEYFPDINIYELFLSERYKKMEGAKLYFSDIVRDTTFFLKYINSNIYERETKKILYNKILKIAEEKNILPELITGLIDHQ